MGSRRQFINRLIDYPCDTIKQSKVDKLQIYVNKMQYDTGQVRQQNDATRKMSEWVISLVAYRKTKLGQYDQNLYSARLKDQ